MPRNSTEPSSLRFSRLVAVGSRSSSSLTASGTNLDSSPFSCSSASRRCREACRFSSAVASSVLRAARSRWVRARCSVMSFSAPPSSPTSSPAPARALPGKASPPVGGPPTGGAGVGPPAVGRAPRREPHRRDQDRHQADHDLAVALQPYLRHDRLHRGGHLDDRAHRVIRAVAALAALLVGDRLGEGGGRGPPPRLAGPPGRAGPRGGGGGGP